MPETKLIPTWSTIPEARGTWYADTEEHDTPIDSILGSCKAASMHGIFKRSFAAHGISASEDWSQLARLFENYRTEVAARAQSELQFTMLQRVVTDIKTRVIKLESKEFIIVPVETFEPEPFDAVRKFHVVVEPDEDQFIATLYDANVSASGDNPQEAVTNLKDIMLSTFEELENEKKLGTAMQRKMAVLKSLIRRR